MTLLSVIVPVYNEEDNIEPLYEAVNGVLQKIADRYTWEFIFTDNCSTDLTYERLERLASRDSRVRVYRFTKNFGFQRSILAGYRLARGDAAAQIDCDLQDPPALILDFVKLWEVGYKIVYGVRKARPEPRLIHAMRRLFYRLIAWMSFDDLPYDAGDFRLVDRKVLDLLHGYNDESPYLRGFIASLGYRQIGVDYDRSERQRGSSSFGFASLLNLALDGIVSHSIMPLRLASIVGISLFVLAIVAIIVYVGLYVVYEQRWPAGFATLAFFMLVSLAMNAVFFGIIGEYLARIYRQIKPRPVAIVERALNHHEPPRTEGERRGTYNMAGIVLPSGSEPDCGMPKSTRDAV